MTAPETFLNDRITLHSGDCFDILRAMPDASIDAIVTDPPYALTQDKRGGTGVASLNPNSPAGRARISTGFMGKAWDTGERAHDVAFWSECLRVLKPGGHVLAFAANRTSHRLTCAIEDAGFEIRDLIWEVIAADTHVSAFVASLNEAQQAAFWRCCENSTFGGMCAWIFGSGFPKSHNVSKGIDYRGGAQLAWFGPWLREWRERRGISQAELAAHFPSKTGGKTGRVSNFELGVRLPTVDDFNLICRVLELPFASLEEAEREVIGRKGGDPERFRSFAEQDGNGRRTFNDDITVPATDAARQWDGWGTALKPALEPITVARKPLIGTVVETVLKHGTGALNIDGCRIPSGADHAAKCASVVGLSSNRNGDCYGTWTGERTDSHSPLGRFPANVIHDGSDEVLSAFPERTVNTPAGLSTHTAAFGGGWKPTQAIARENEGSAARFFYSAKADDGDRLGSKHPTIKPVDLMRYLVRLVTPPGGLVLDPFAGTGTTGEAAWREGMRAVLCEREEAHCADIRRRMALCLAGPDERRRETIKAKTKDKPVDHGPLFGLLPGEAA